MTTTEPRAPRDQESWARPVDRLTTTAKGAGQDTVTGKRVAGPVQGFGQMWQKTFTVRVPARRASRPRRVVAHWKAALPDLLAEGLDVLRAAGRDHARARSRCSRSRPSRARPSRCRRASWSSTLTASRSRS